MTYEGAHRTRAAAEADLPRLRTLYPDREPYIAEQGEGEQSWHVHSRPIHTDDCPTEAHSHEPWTDDDTAELAAAMADAAWRIADRHSEARAGGVFARTIRLDANPAILTNATRFYREDRVADRMGDDWQPDHLPVIDRYMADLRRGTLAPSLRP